MIAMFFIGYDNKSMIHLILFEDMIRFRTLFQAKKLEQTVVSSNLDRLPKSESRRFFRVMGEKVGMRKPAR